MVAFAFGDAGFRVDGGCAVGAADGGDGGDAGWVGVLVGGVGWWGIFSFGDARFYGSTGGQAIPVP